MRKLLSTLAFSIILVLGLFAQNKAQEAREIINTKNQVTVQFIERDLAKLKLISHKISIDNYKDGLVTAVLSKIQIDPFLDLNYNYTIIPETRNINVLNVATSVSEMSNWDQYPSYSVYTQMMYDFATNHSNICKLDTIGTSQNGHLILVIKITDNPNIDENEAEFFYTGQMHGDEIVAGVMFLRLIDYLLNNYGSNTEITNLINNVEIWINPVANPDGMYNGGDENVSNSSRYFANGVDPNRNFPNPVDGDHSDNNPWAIETIDMMSFTNAHNFVVSANSHSGAEVVNYPWDSWNSNEKLTADDNWWQFVSQEYADLAQSNSPTTNPSPPDYDYMTKIETNGITEGADWYYAFGSRQDYMNYFKNCRELTLELSNNKLLSSDLLPDHWEYNRDAFIAYLKQVQYGINGIVTNNCTGEPIKAKIEIENHDIDNSFVYSALPLGDFHRPIYEGTYNVIISAQGYESLTFNNISVSNYTTTTLNASLNPLAPITNFEYELLDPCLGIYSLINTTPGNNSYLWTFPGATQSTNTNEQITFTENGSYTVQLEATNICSGSNSTSQNIELTHLSATPTSESPERCGPGEVTYTATANGSGTISWYDSENGNLIQTGNSYTTNISDNTTIWVEETGNTSTFFGAKVDNSGIGDYYDYSTKHGLIFDCNEELILKNVTVYANGAENRELKLLDDNSNIIYQQSYSIPDGESTINLNWVIPEGLNYYFYGPSNPNLYRDGGSGAPNLPYPYNIDNKISITGNTANNSSYYYYFYNWEIESTDCSSPRIPITAIVSAACSSNFTYVQNTNEITFTNNSTNGASYYWDFGDGTNSEQENPTHTYTSNNNFLVTLTTTNSCGSNDYSETISITDVFVNNITKQDFIIYPNPAKKTITIEHSELANKTLEILDVSGKLIFTYKPLDSKLVIDIEKWDKGIYFIQIDHTIRKVVKL